MIAGLATECTIDHSAERGQAAVDGFTRGKAIGRAAIEAELLDQGWTPPGAVVEHAPSSDGAFDRAEATAAGYARGVADERVRSNAAVLAHHCPPAVEDTLVNSRYPTEYEVWRDALTLSVTNVFPPGDDEHEAMTGATDRSAQITADAEWFWELLQQVPVLKFEDRTKPDDALADRYEDDRSGPAE
jgi:hypothetical protein